MKTITQTKFGARIGSNMDKVEDGTAFAITRTDNLNKTVLVAGILLPFWIYRDLVLGGASEVLKEALESDLKGLAGRGYIVANSKGEYVPLDVEIEGIL